MSIFPGQEKTRMQSGDKLGHFEILHKLGAGGMGEVYLAQDQRLGRSVAIKILPPELAADSGRRARFAREAKAASALNHPNIAHIYDVGDQDGTHFIAMEYVEGRDLDQRLSDTSLDQDETLNIAIQIADALEEARGKGIIHRDIKPANIALTGRGEVKVLDFGLAKLTAPLDSETGNQTATLSQTAEGTVLGTAHYMSPEQAQGGHIDTRSDLFSLGAVLYEMVAGRKAFAGEALLGIIHAISHHTPEALARFNYEVSPELERIILKCLEKDPDHRYQTPRDLMVDLKNLQRTSISGSVSDVVPAPRVAKTGSRRLMPLVLVPVIAAVIAAAYFLIPWSGAHVDALAVLPFENETGDPEVDYLCNGVTESLINTMAQIPDLKVISRRSAFALKGRDLDAAAAGRELDVDVVLFGRVVQHGTELTISTELVDTRNSRQLWGQRYNRQLSELLDVENEITRTIAKTLKVELAGGHAELAAPGITENPEAYRLYLMGREFTTGTRREMDKAVEYFQKAIALDSNYALPYAGLASSYTTQSYLRGGERDEILGKARAAARKAMELDPNLPEAYTAAGMIKLVFDLDFEGAEADLIKGLELGPGKHDTVMPYGDFLLLMGRYDEARATYERAMKLDPLSVIAAHDMGFVNMLMKNYEKCAFYFKKAIDINPNWTWGHVKLALNYSHMGQCDQALASTEIAESLLAGSDTPATRAWLGFTYARCGEEEKAKSSLAALQAMAETQYVDPALFAGLYLGLRDLDQAIAYYEEAMAERSPGLVYFHVSPDIYMDELGEDPRFQAMLKKIGF
jgi:TolB-like protein/Tfp pilus assembly protein PilF/tRNA A-37 threonylcarbamoyl transferase component Bud32